MYNFCNGVEGRGEAKDGFNLDELLYAKCTDRAESGEKKWGKGEGKPKFVFNIM